MDKIVRLKMPISRIRIIKDDIMQWRLTSANVILAKKVKVNTWQVKAQPNNR